MPAILFGSISSLADTSELQREAFNEAFAQNGLDWHWDREEYREMLRGNGGQQRIEDQAAERGQSVDAASVHTAKSELFQQRLATVELTPRPGVTALVRAAKAAGHTVGLVTTTSPENVDALLSALASHLDRADLTVVIDRTQVDQPKPDPEVYSLVLRTLDVPPGEAVAIEDNVGGVQAAVAAGIACVAFPNSNTAGHDFSGAALVVDRLDADVVLGLVAT